jgi:carboxypeptidase family protein
MSFAPARLSWRGPALVALLVVCLAALRAPLAAQSGSGAGTIEGVVLDPDSRPVAGVTVILRNEATGYQRTVETNGTGRFSAVAMPVGSYAVEAMAPRFATQRLSGVRLAVGATPSLTVKLGLAALTEQVTVSGEATRLDPTLPSTSTSINLKAVSDLPIRGRNFVEFALLTPNISQEANRNGLVVNGQRSINSNISIDGVDVNDSLQGNQRGGNDATYSFPQSAIREFQVVRTGAAAEVGRTNAGFVNVVTKSGTNIVGGEAFYANRNGTLTSRDAFGNSSANNSQHQTGGALGGPLKRDRLFFFGAVEKNLLTIPYTVAFNTPSQPAGQPPVVVPAEILAQQGLYEGQNNPLVGFVRIDTQIAPSHNLNVQYTYSSLGGLNFSVKNALTNQAVTNNNVLTRRSQGIKVALTSVLSRSVVNEIRAQTANDDRFQRPASPLPQIAAGRPTTAPSTDRFGGPRQVQLGVRFTF